MTPKQRKELDKTVAKIRRVIESCATADHLAVARKFTRAGMRRIDSWARTPQPYQLIADCLFQEFEQLLSEKQRLIVG